MRPFAPVWLCSMFAMVIAIAAEPSPDDSIAAARRETGKPAVIVKADLPGGEKHELERKSTEPIFNPLAGFLGDWMSAEDFALLGSNLQKPIPETAIAAGTTASRSVVVPPSGNAIATMDAMIGGLGASKRAFAPPTARDNPYLAVVNEPLLMPSLQPPPSAVGAPPIHAPLPTIGATESAPSASASKVPDFAKPQSDHKFFKPLKRF